MEKIIVHVECAGVNAYEAYAEISKGLMAGGGKTPKKAVDDFLLCYEEFKEMFDDVPKDFDFSFEYDLPSYLFELKKTFSFTKLQQLTGVKKERLKDYAMGKVRPSSSVSSKIYSNLSMAVSGLQANKLSIMQ